MKTIQSWYNVLSVPTIAILFVLLFMRECSGDLLKNAVKHLATPAETVIRIDTFTNIDTLVQIKTDSFYQDRIVYLDKIIHERPDTVFVIERDTINRYVGVSSDTLLDITYKANVVGELRDISLSYKLKKPTTIFKTITETITETKTITKDIYRGGLYLGIGANYTPRVDPSIYFGANYVTRKGWAYGYGYAPNTKSHFINVQKRLF